MRTNKRINTKSSKKYILSKWLSITCTKVNQRSCLSKLFAPIELYLDSVHDCDAPLLDVCPNYVFAVVDPAFVVTELFELFVGDWMNYKISGSGIGGFVDKSIEAIVFVCWLWLSLLFWLRLWSTLSLPLSITRDMCSL